MIYEVFLFSWMSFITLLLVYYIIIGKRGPRGPAGDVDYSAIKFQLENYTLKDHEFMVELIAALNKYQLNKGDITNDPSKE